jgi:hypothetical protein
MVPTAAFRGGHWESADSPRGFPSGLRTIPTPVHARSNARAMNTAIWSRVQVAKGR